jgi:hypothetical protein
LFWNRILFSLSPFAKILCSPVSPFQQLAWNLGQPVLIFDCAWITYDPAHANGDLASLEKFRESLQSFADSGSLPYKQNGRAVSLHSPARDRRHHLT